MINDGRSNKAIAITKSDGEIRGMLRQVNDRLTDLENMFGKFEEAVQPVLAMSPETPAFAEAPRTAPMTMLGKELDAIDMRIIGLANAIRRTHDRLQI